MICSKDSFHRLTDKHINEHHANFAKPEVENLNDYQSSPYIQNDGKLKNIYIHEQLLLTTSDLSHNDYKTRIT